MFDRSDIIFGGALIIAPSLGLFVGCTTSEYSHAGTYTFLTVVVLATIAIIAEKNRAKKKEKKWKQEQALNEQISRKREESARQEHKAKIDIKKLKLQSIYETIGGVDVSIDYDSQEERRVVVNEKNKIIVVDEEVFDWCDIISFEVKDNSVVCTSSFTKPSLATTTTDTGSMLGRAVVGGLVSGGIGAVIGGATASKTTTIKNGTTTTTSKTTHDYSINITVNRIKNPIIVIKLGPDENKTDQLAGVLAVIINQNNQSANENLEQPVCSVSHSITDELIKLADLREKGILTEDEFKQQKAKLLYK